MSNETAIKLRPALEADAPFIFNSWLKSNRNSPLWANVDSTVYYNEHHKIIEKLLKRGRAMVAVDDKDPSRIFGYICFEEVEGQRVIHYCYVKHLYRGLGIGNMLLAETGHDKTVMALFTHWSPAAAKFFTKYNLLFHPYILLNY